MTKDKYRGECIMNNILYGYNLKTMKKFEVSTEDICQTINCDEGFSDNYFVYTTKEDRDFHYEENVDD